MRNETELLLYLQITFIDIAEICDDDFMFKIVQLVLLENS